MDAIGIVVIGRNEGERLLRCLGSVLGRGHAVVYVDSGSRDESVARARELGAEVLELDLTTPFTAARARNAGLDRLLELAPTTQFVQFVDGDCEVIGGWLDQAGAALEARPDLAIVCGRLRERDPGRSIYNRLADLEWDAPAGDALVCGGIIMARVAALEQVGGFDPSMIAGEEPELCVRLRRRGWKITRLDAEMAWHDIGMTRFSQWWRRTIRNGYAYAAGSARQGRTPEKHWVREARSNWFWGLMLPLLALGAAWPTRSLSLILLAGYPVLAVRVARAGRRRGWSRAEAWLYAGACVLGKFPMMLGQLKFAWARGRAVPLIEYKGPATTRPGTPVRVVAEGAGGAP